MRFKLDPLSASGVSVAADVKPVVKQSHGYISSDVPTVGNANQVLQKSAGTGTFWGVALTVGTSQPTAPAVNDLWIDTN